MNGRWVAALAAAVLLILGAGARADNDRVVRLVELLNESSSHLVRIQSALSLGRLGDEAAIPALVDALDDEHPGVRAAAASSLGRLGATAAGGELSRLASDRAQPDLVSLTADQALERLRALAVR